MNRIEQLVREQLRRRLEQGGGAESPCSRRRAPARAPLPPSLRGSVVAPTPSPGPARPQRSGRIKLSWPEKAPFSPAHPPPHKLDVTPVITQATISAGTAPQVPPRPPGGGCLPHPQARVTCAGSRGLGAAPSLPAASSLQRGDRASALFSRPRDTLAPLLFFWFLFCCFALLGL